MGIFSGSGKDAKEYRKKQNVLAAAEIETVEAEKARTIAAEQARAKVMGLLGQPGTYGTPGTTGAPPAGQAPGTDYYQPGETFGEAGSSLAMAQFRGGGYSPQIKAWESRAGILDPEKYAAETAKTSAFRQVSGRIAEAEQLVNREGPMWDMLESSTYGVLHEGSARALREETRALRDSAAKGGTARNVARQRAEEAIAIERNNWELTNKTFQANVALFDLTRQNQEKALDMGYKLVDNLPEIRQAYSTTMSNLAKLMSGTALPYASQMLERGQIPLDAQPKTSILQRVIGGVVGAAQGYFSGGALGGLLGGALGAAGPEVGFSAGAAGGYEAGSMSGLLSGAAKKASTSPFTLWGTPKPTTTEPKTAAGKVVF